MMMFAAARFVRLKTAPLIALLLWPLLSVLGQTPPMRENLGPNVNSEYDEVFPIISADGRTLYFVRKDHPKNIGGAKDDIWYSELGPDGTWSAAKNVGYPLNTEGFNYVCYALPDNNALLLGNHYLPEGKQRQGVSMSFRGPGGWQHPVNLFISDFENRSKNCEFTMSPDGNVMIMSIKTSDSFSGDEARDLYVSFLQEDNTWSKPKNLGSTVNGRDTEITPFLAADGVTLYFSSDRPGGFGSNDVYMTQRLDDTWLKWTAPRNLGWPINTAGWDAYYTVPASGKYAYFVSTVDGFGRSDIFRIELPKEAKPKAVLLVKGRVTDPKGTPLPARILYERIGDRKQLGSAMAHPTTGAFTIALPAGQLYGFHAEYEGYYPVSENVDLRDMEEYREIERNLILVPIESGSVIRMNNIFFEFNKAVLSTESISELDRLFDFLQSQPNVGIMIAGHTDNIGTEEYNERLSLLRAQAVLDYLIGKGISRSRLTAKGYGKSKPVETNETEEGRQRNRRVEFTIF